MTAFFLGVFLSISCSSDTVTSDLVRTGADSPAKVQSETDSDLLSALGQVRRATAPYQDLGNAEEDGYVQFSPHVPNMGYHYLHDSNINADGSSALDNKLDRKDPEILVYVDDSAESSQRRLVAAEYAVPKESGTPPQNAQNLFPGLTAHDWHVHPSTHELPLSDDWTVHGECHYQGGLGVFLAEDPGGNFVLFTPPTGAFGSWSGTVAPDQCPGSLGGNPLPPLLIAHGKWWTLHAWVWYDNPDGVFHPTNARIEP